MGVPAEDWSKVDAFLDKVGDVLDETHRINTEAQDLLEGVALDSP